MKIASKPRNSPRADRVPERRELGGTRKHRSIMAELHRRAEARLRKQQTTRNRKRERADPAADPRRQLHELQVHQIELEMQNAELQEARARSEALLAKYTDLYDFAPVSYFTLGRDGTILQVNLTGARLVGIERPRLVGRSFGLLVCAHLRPIFNSFLKQVFAGRAKPSGEFILSSAGPIARSVSIEVRRSPSRDECYAVVVDLTERKQAEVALRRNEALFSALIEQAPYGVYVVDASLRFQQVNQKAQPVFNNVRPLLGSALPHVLRLLWPRPIADEAVSRFRHTLKTGEPYQSSDFTARRRDTGLEENYEWQIQRVTLPGGEYAVVTFFNEITERKRVEQAQRRMDVLTASNRKLEQEIVRRHAVEQSLKQSESHQAQLLAQSRQMEGLLRELSRRVLRVQEEERTRISRELHDVIAQTLTSINIHLSNLQKEATINPNGFEGLDESIARTKKIVEHSVNIVHRFARELRPTVLDDLGLIPALHTFLKNLREHTGLRVSLSAFAAVEGIPEDKRTVLYRVAQEALTNAARHARASHADVTIEKVAGAVCMKVTDNGIGFRTDHLSRNGKNKRLGLLGMKERLEMVGGTVHVSSVPGKGTIVMAQIPFVTVRARGAKTR